jgi:hypothetical protein
MSFTFTLVKDKNAQKTKNPMDAALDLQDNGRIM